MIDGQTQEIELALEVGFQVRKTGPDSYQFQKLDGRGRVTCVTPTQKHTHDLWLKFVETAKALGTALDEGGEAGDGVSPKSSPSVRVA